MSVRVMAWVFEHAPTTDPVAHLVLLAIADRCDDAGQQAYPSVATLAKRTRLGRSTVLRALDRLEAMGVLSVAHREGRQHTNIYSIVMGAQSQTGTGATAGPVPERDHPRPALTLPPSRSDTGTGPGAGPNTSVRPSTSLTSNRATSPSAPGPRAEELLAAWNELTQAPIPRCVKLTPARRRTAQSRLKDPGLTEMRDVFARINASSFCRGENDRNWRASFDWAIKPATIAKVLEDTYARGGQRKHAGRTGAAPAGKYDGLAQTDDLLRQAAS